MPITSKRIRQHTFDVCITHIRKQRTKNKFIVKGKIVYKCDLIKELIPDNETAELLDCHYLTGDTKWHKQFFAVYGHSFHVYCAMQTVYDEIDRVDWENEFQQQATILGCIYQHHVPVSTPNKEEDTLLGYLIQGNFVALKHVGELLHYYPVPVPIYKSNVGRHSLVCSLSHDVIIDGQSSGNKRISIF